MTDDEARQARARERAARIVRVMPGARDPWTLTPAERVALCTELSRWAWDLSGRPWPSYTRAEIPVRVIRRRGT